MAKVKVLNISGEEVSSVELPDDLFANDKYDHVLHEVVRYQQANRRQGTAATKNRPLVRGGGKKIYRQKGTGRARHGGSRAPQFRGGGVAHGPRPRSYAFKLNKKLRRGALKSALTRRASAEQVLVFDSLELSEIKTKPVAQLLAKLGVSSALFVLPEQDGTFQKSARNIPYVKVLAQEGLNVEDILRHKHLCLTTDAVEKLSERLQA
ncbi:MAG TPA: 50S ribosomal protein L4 [Deltaproteobacteria bacterium]|nr:50S ribosomal protein L4 [Deltaproteobacteria bacterium]HCP45015.1 50S ribosomal protein L4 [Deltaproteobacteria bacterium]